MSQQMDYNESAPQHYDSGYQGGEYKDPFAGSYNVGQKVGVSFQPSTSRTPSAGQRLALAIVSVCILVPLAGAVLGISGGIAGSFGIILGLIILGVMAAAILGINIAFNLARH